MQLVKVFHPEVITGTLTIAFFGSYACITLYEQYRMCSRENKPKILHPIVLLFLMAVSVGGVAIWCMHFVAMAGMEFYTEDTRTRVHVKYRVDLTAASFIVVIFVTFVGLRICSLDKAFVQDQNDVVDRYVEDVKTRSIQDIRMIDSKRRVLFRTLFKNMRVFFIGGVLVAGGVCIMHYIGMQAMIFDGYIRWNVGIVAASVIIAVVAGSAALWILFRLLAVFPEKEVLRFASALVMAVAVNGMHYTGMAAGEFVYEKNRQHPDYGLVDQYTAVLVALIATAVFLWTIFILAAADLRVWYYHSSFIVKEADIRVEYYREHPFEVADFYEDYLALRGIDYKSNISRVKVREQLRQGHSSGQNSANLSKYEVSVLSKSLSQNLERLPNTRRGSIDPGTAATSERYSIMPNQSTDPSLKIAPVPEHEVVESQA
jgi:NO-binding membrane sensor protein with MHYT domain